MSNTQSASALTRALVHASAQHPAAKLARHQAFIAEKLMFSAAALAAVPLFLVYHGAPTLTEAAILALARLQTAAAMVVVQTGRLLLGHAVAAAGFVGIAMALVWSAFASGTPADAIACFCWLALACVEAVSSFNLRLYSVVVAAIAAVVVADTAFHLATATSFEGAGLMAGIALLATLPIARRTVAFHEQVRMKAERDTARSRAVSQALGDLVIGFDGNGLVDHASADCEGLLDVPCGKLAGRGLFEHVHVADRPAFLKLVADAADDGGTHTGQLRLRSGSDHINDAGHAEPRHLWVEMRTHRLTVADAQAAGVVAVLRDIGERRQHSVAIDDAKRSVDSAVRSKDEFLANMSHELRTPLNAIIGFSEMLSSQTMRPIAKEKQREYAQIIHQSGQNLLAMVNSILDMTKIQSGTFSLLPEPFELVPLVDQCCDMIHLKAQAGVVEIVRDVPAELEEIIGDRRACKQILSNLLSNAVKFTPERGRVTVRVRPEGTSICIAVSDTGIGIGAADLVKLGEPFFQVRGSICRPYDGTGLGLSMVRGLVGLHGGTIAIESEVDQGTSVTVRLPIDCRVIAASEAATIDLNTRRLSASTSRASESRRFPNAHSALESGIKLIA